MKEELQRLPQHTDNHSMKSAKETTYILKNHHYDFKGNISKLLGFGKYNIVYICERNIKQRNWTLNVIQNSKIWPPILPAFKHPEYSKKQNLFIYWSLLASNFLKITCSCKQLSFSLTRSWWTHKNSFQKSIMVLQTQHSGNKVEAPRS